MTATLRRGAMRLWAALRRDRADAEAAREIAAHLALLEDGFRSRGMSGAEAARAARLALGGVDQTLERHRDARTWRWLDDLRSDLGHALRGLNRARGFALLVVVTLALGIGATSAIFRVVHTLLVAPLPYAVEPERLVRLVRWSPDPRRPHAPPQRAPVPFTATEAAALDDAARLLDAAGIFAPMVVSVPGLENAGHLSVARLSSSTWAVLGVTPMLGRAFSAADDTADIAVAVLSYRAWQQLFAGDPDVVGRTLSVQTVLGQRVSRSLHVVGVMPPSFTFPSADTALWTTLGGLSAGRPPPRGTLLARLCTGATPEAALAEIDAVVREQHGFGPETRLALLREPEQLADPVRPALVVLAAIVALLLLIACLNVANLLLARTLARSRELSVRAALGASRSRLARQCLTESAVLGVIGGVGGLAVAAGALRLFRALATTLSRIDLGTVGLTWGSGPFPRLDELTADASLVAIAAATAIVSGLAVGVGAALRASRADVFGATRAVGASARIGVAAGRARSALAVLQVAAAMALLTAAVLLTRSLQHLLRTDPGYVSEQVLTFQVTLPAAVYPDARLQAFAEAVAERLGAVPGVVAAAYANQLPMVQLRDTAGGLWDTPDPTRKGGGDAPDARFVSRDYFAAMGIRIVAGRGFGAGDGAGQPRVLLVNETLARGRFAGRDPIGAEVFIGRDVVPWRIVGVVADVRQFGLDRPAEPQFFADLRQWQGGMPLFPTGAYYVVKHRSDASALVPEIRAVVRGLDADAALFNVAPMDAIVAATVARPRLYAVLASGFALLGAVLAAIGVYGVLAFLVHERTAEIGVRMALGAGTGQVLAMVMRQGAALLAAGLGLGTAVGLALARSAAALLFGIAPLDPRTFVAAALLLAALASVAVLVPARRASRLDPLVALRHE